MNSISSDFSSIPRPDRLARLMRGLTVETIARGDLPGAGFHVTAGAPGYVLRLGTKTRPALASARITWAGAVARLGVEGVDIAVAADSPAAALADLFLADLAQPRCGTAALSRSYVEALIVHALRAAIDRGLVAGGPMAGLADASLGRALAAIHDAPERRWTLDDLAGVAAMSRSAFALRFNAIVGVTPMRYLRDWRMAEARAALAEGARVGAVARRYGYGSADAFSRAYRRAEGERPADRRAASAAPFGA